jgi:mitotic spindle assembly checkpoint protein MAD2
MLFRKFLIVLNVGKISLFFICSGFSVSREKSDKEIMREIQAIMRQIASSITYLPCLDEACKNHLLFPNDFNCVLSVYSNQYLCLCLLFVLGVFDVLAYTDKDIAVPFTWIESDPKLIANPQMVKLHSFDTKVSLPW